MAPIDRLEEYQTRAEWLAARSIDYRIGGSEVAAILGVSPWSGPWDVWARKKGYEEPRESQAMARGSIMEPAVLGMYQHETGREVIDLGHALIPHESESWAVASCDGLARDGDELGIVEAKTSAKIDIWEHSQDLASWADGAERVLPPHYALQCYWYMECTGLPWCDLVVMLPFFEVRVYRLHRDPVVQSAILARVKAWRDRYLVGGETPPLDGSSAAAHHIAREHPGDPEKPYRDATPEECQLIDQILDNKDQAAELDKARAVLENRLRESIGDGYKVLAPNGSAVYTIDQGKGRRLTVKRRGK